MSLLCVGRLLIMLVFYMAKWIDIMEAFYKFQRPKDTQKDRKSVV